MARDISGKERTQGEFAHTFNDLYEGRSQIVVSADCPPRKIPEIERVRAQLEQQPTLLDRVGL